MAGNATFTIWNRVGGTLKSASYYTSLYEFGNTRFRGTDSGTGNALAIGTKHMHSGKWYFEFLVSGSPAGGWPAVGIMAATDVSTGQATGNPQMESIFSWVFATDGNLKAFGGTTNASYGTSFSDGDIYNLAVDIDAGKAWWGKNNTYFNSGNPATGTNAGQTFTAGTDMAVCMTGYVGAAKLIINSGQDSNFSGEKSTGTNSAADGNGYGDFYYAPPSGYLSLCSANLPTSTDIDPGGDDGETENPTEHFGVLTYTGNGTARTLSGLGFQPDLIWTKRLSGTNKRHYLVDSSRGFTKYLHSDGTFTQGTSTDGVTSATSDGFAVGGSLDYVNENTSTYVAWCWRANGGTTATNTSGTATSTVQANTKAGFSIILTDNYTAATGVTVGHGLGKAPAFYLHKTTGDNSSGGASQNFTWHVYHKSLGATKAMFLDTNAGASTAIGYWNNTEPTSTVLSLGNLIAGNGQSLVYAWSEIEGFSKFGQYTANSNSDGPFQYCGFRPRLVWIKMTVSGDNWGVWDSERGPQNPIDNIVFWSTEAAESSNDYYRVDFMANGFKIRDGNAQINHTSYDPYIWGAWGDVPFKYNNAF